MSSQRSNQQPAFPLISHPTNAAHHFTGQADHGNNYMSSECKRFNNEENYNFQYYEEYKKLYFTAYCLSIQLKKIIKTKDDLCTKLAKIEKKAQEQSKQESRDLDPNRKKRVRRTAEEIERKYQCNVERCGRNYGSQGSLQQHIKLKHPQLYAARLQQNGYHHYSSQQESL